LLLQCFGKISGALAEVVSALAQFVEQPRVLDGDDCLGGEVLDEFDLLVRERGELPGGFQRKAPITSSSFTIECVGKRE
jgi:hypothetical protein